MLLNPYRFGAPPAVPSFWIATLGGAGGDNSQVAGTVAVDASDNIYVVGETASAGAGSSDLVLAKYDPSGALIWQRLLGLAGSDIGRGIAVTGSGDVYVTGVSTSGVARLLLARYSSAGSLQWQRVLGDGANSGELGFGVALAGSTAVYVVGGSYSAVSNGEFLVARYNSSGTLQWQRTIGGGSTDFGYGAISDTSENLYAVGFSSSVGAGSSDIFITKFNSSGTLQWQRALGGTASDMGRQIGLDGSGNIYVCGITASSGAGSNDMLLAKYDSSAALLWQRVLGGTGDDGAQDIAVTSSGDVYVVGYTQPSGAGSDDLVLSKYATDGSIQWQRTLSGSGAETGSGIALDSTGAIIIAGSSNSSGAGGNDLLLARLPGDGSLTGIYGDFTYAASSLTGAAGTLTSVAPSLSATPRTLASQTGTLTDAAGTLASNKVGIP